MEIGGAGVVCIGNDLIEHIADELDAVSGELHDPLRDRQGGADMSAVTPMNREGAKTLACVDITTP
jgi:hypothetical protein